MYMTLVYMTPVDHPTCHPQMNATDHALFTTTAMGKLWTSIPYEKGLQNITLQEVLYCPDIAFTHLTIMMRYGWILHNTKRLQVHH